MQLGVATMGARGLGVTRAGARKLGVVCSQAFGCSHGHGVGIGARTGKVLWLGRKQ